MCYSLHQGYIKDALRGSRKENDASWELMLLKDCTIVVLKAQGRVYENTALRMFHFLLQRPYIGFLTLIWLMRSSLDENIIQIKISEQNHPV